MRYGIILTAGNIQEIAAMAAEAEAAGWDGVFYWDGMAIPGADLIYDPWVTLAVIAMRTERVRFGATSLRRLAAAPGSSRARPQPSITSREGGSCCRWDYTGLLKRWDCAKLWG